MEITFLVEHDSPPLKIDLFHKVNGVLVSTLGKASFKMANHFLFFSHRRHLSHFSLSNLYTFHPRGHSLFFPSLSSLPLGLHSLKETFLDSCLLHSLHPTHMLYPLQRALSLLTYSIPSLHPPTHTQAFIHPSLARFFWSAARSDPPSLTWSPYEYCNGTFTAAENHSFSFHQSDADLEKFVFIDFAGSGLVHLCGKTFSVVSAVILRH